MLLLLAIIIVIIAGYFLLNDTSSLNTSIKKLNECPDVTTGACDINKCNCPYPSVKPKYKKSLNNNGIDTDCYYCGKRCVTETNVPSTIQIANTDEVYTLNDVVQKEDGSIAYSPKYAYTENDINNNNDVANCYCLNNNQPIRKNILSQNNFGEIINKTAYICGGNNDGSRKYQQNDITKEIYNKITQDRTINLEPKRVSDVVDLEVVQTQISDVSISSSDFASSIINIVNQNIDNDKINEIKEQTGVVLGGTCPTTGQAKYLNNNNDWVVDDNYIFSGDPIHNENVQKSCDSTELCDCKDNNTFTWQLKNSENVYIECKTCGNLICPDEEDANIVSFTKNNGSKTMLSCSEIMYNGLKNTNIDNYINKCKCEDGKQLHRRKYTIDGIEYTCDTCETIVNPCATWNTSNSLNNSNMPSSNDRCTVDSSCQCPRDENGEALSKINTIYYGPGNVIIKTNDDEFESGYKQCYMCGKPINSRIYDICEDKISGSACELSSKLQILLNDIDNEIDDAKQIGKNYIQISDGLKERIQKYVSGEELDYNSMSGDCLQKHTIYNLFKDILSGYRTINYIDTGNVLSKKKTCNDIAHMSSEIDTGDGVNCRYNIDEDEIFSIMGKLTYKNNYSVSEFGKTPQGDKDKLSNIIKYYSDDLYDLNRTMQNCSKTCDTDYKKHYGIDAFNNLQQNTDKWRETGDNNPSSNICKQQASMYCPSYDGRSDEWFAFSKRVSDFCLNKGDNCNAYTYIKHENDNYINDKVKGLCPSACWNCDENAVLKAREFIRFVNSSNASVNKEPMTIQEEDEIIAAYVNESKQLRKQINTGLDVLTSRSGFTKYVDDLKFNIIDMVNRWDFKYKLANDIDLKDNCMVDQGHFLESADCRIVDSKDKIEPEFRTDKSEILDGLYGYCKKPLLSKWMKSIKKTCSSGLAGDTSPICTEVDNSNSFVFKLDGVKDCFGSIDINSKNGSNAVMQCINNKLSNACIDNVREMQDSYDAQCRTNFENCVTSMACGVFTGYGVDNTRIDENELKNNPLCKRCVNDAFDCSVRNNWAKKKNTLYPSNNTPHTAAFYKVDNCPVSDTCDPIVASNYDCVPSLTTLCQAPRPGSLDFSFWVDDNNIKVPEKKNEFEWYINNWWKGYPDENKNCKGRWVLKYGNDYCDKNTCNITNLSFSMKISNDITRMTAKSKLLTIYFETAINDYIYQHIVNSYDHINGLLSKILWATKYKADPNPECGTKYDKYIFNDIILLLNDLKANDKFKSGIPTDYRLRLEQMLNRLSTLKPEIKTCYINEKAYNTGSTKISNVDLNYLLSSRKYLFFNDADIKRVYNTLNPNSVSTNVTLTNDSIATFNIEFKNITYDIANKIKDLFNTQDNTPYASASNDLFVKYLFGLFGIYRGNSFVYKFKDVLNYTQIINTKIQLNNLIKVDDNNLSGNRSGNYVWLYSKEDTNQLIDCEKAKLRGFVGEFENLNIDILPGMSYSGMEACNVNTALWFGENKCNLQQLTSEKKIPCSNSVLNRERHYDNKVTKSCS